jgi:alginate O-acetyltransferase complex protein AlgI
MSIHSCASAHARHNGRQIRRLERALLFNSFEFFGFLAVVLVLYRFADHAKQNAILLVASYVFYGWWDWRFLSLIALSTTIDFFCALAIAPERNPTVKRRLLLISLCSNLGILGFFKYFDFFVASGAGLLETLGFGVSIPTLSIILPVGISFYTFQTMGYTIDVYRGEQTPTRNFATFALYVAYFPQLVAGPIERSRRLLPQLTNARRVDGTDWVVGAQLIVLGLFKKLCIADGVAPYVDRAFSDPAGVQGPEMLLCVYLFALQIYGDFSGYSDIARGVSRLFGIRLVVNFRQPYLSESISEFWRRWHISLSTWLRDYLYISLGGNRSGSLRTYRNLSITMLLGGLWHGASWNFVIWGGLHGVFLALHRMWNPRRSLTMEPEGVSSPAIRAIRIAVTFHLVCFLWIFFRAGDLAASTTVLTSLVSAWSAPPPVFAITALIFMLAVLLLDWAARDHPESLPIRDTWTAWQRGLLFASLVVAISLIGDTNVRPFLYFQF